MPYCLAQHEDWHDNIIDDEAIRFVENEIERNRQARTPFPLHKYVHHGLSSQVMLFNLVGPMAGRKDIRPLKLTLAEVGVPWPEGDRVEMEYEDRDVFDERQVQPTSIDLVLGDPNVPNAIFIECKLVETGFGGCGVFADGDCDGANPSDDYELCYLHRVGRRYLNHMHVQGLLDTKLATDTYCAFVNHYQFYRELLMTLDKQGYFVLLGDARSPVFLTEDETGRRGLWRLLVSLLPDEIKSRVAFIPIHRIIEHAEEIGGHDWTVAFRKKYGLEMDTV